MGENSKEPLRTNAAEAMEITVELPDGRKLVAFDKQDPDYPGIKIELHFPDGRAETIA